MSAVTRRPCDSDPNVTADECSGTMCRLASIRAAIESASISWEQLAELQSLADFIDPGDVVLLQWAGVPEFDDEEGGK